MKKLIASASAFILAAASCASKTPEQTEPVLTEDGRIIVTVGSYGVKDPLMYDSKRIPDDIEIEFIDYCEGYDYDRYYDEYDPVKEKAMAMELDKACAKGDVPDILLIPLRDVKRLNRLGALADLGELMDEYDTGIRRDDLTDAALEGLTLNGCIPALIKSYHVDVPVAKSKFIPEEYTNWTADDAMRFFSEKPEDMTYLNYDYDGSLFSFYMIKLEGYGCFDEESGTCDFSGKFAEILQFCQDHPGEPTKYVDTTNMTKEERQVYQEEQEHATLKDDVMVYRHGCSGLIVPAQKPYEDFFGQDMTFVGYPSENGVGADVYFTDRYLYCISEKSPNKEAAWRLLSKMVTTNYTPDGVISPNPPTEMSIFKKWTSRDYIEYIPFAKKSTWHQLDETNTVPKEYFEKVCDYYTSVPANIYKNNEVWSIIWEESLPAVKGYRTVDEAINILNNRVSLYLSERS